MKFFKKLKEKIQREKALNFTLNLTDKYHWLNLEEPIQAGSVLITVVSDSRLAFFYKEDSWKKYVGVSRSILDDYLGNNFSWDLFYETKDLKIFNRIGEDYIPEEIVKKLFDEIIANKQKIYEVLKLKFIKEWYKE